MNSILYCIFPQKEKNTTSKVFLVEFFFVSCLAHLFSRIATAILANSWKGRRRKNCRGKPWENQVANVSWEMFSDISFSRLKRNRPPFCLGGKLGVRTNFKTQSYTISYQMFCHLHVLRKTEQQPKNPGETFKTLSGYYAHFSLPGRDELISSSSNQASSGKPRRLLGKTLDWAKFLQTCGRNCFNGA